MPRRRQNKPPSYLFTIDPMNPRDDEALAGARQAVRQTNRALRAAGVPIRFRVCISPRLGQSEYKWKYENRFKPSLRFEDAESADVYVRARET